MDHQGLFPPAGESSAGIFGQFAWDDYIHRNIGGVAPDLTLIKGNGLMPSDYCPPLEQCPGDKLPIVQWAKIYDPTRRTYAMNAVGPGWPSGNQIPVSTTASPKSPSTP